MADLKTNYKDDVLDTTQNTKRKYQMIDNGDGTVSFEDVTEYLQQGDSFGADDINDTNGKVNTVEGKLTADDDLVFDFTKSGSEYGYKDANGNFVPFKTTHTDTYTYPSGSTGGTYDMGVNHKNRYVNASNVYTKGKADGKTVHTETYTYPSGSTGATYDMGVEHKYRYVNANNVYNKGKTDGASGKITPSYAYVTSKSYELDASTNGKMTFSATSGYVYAVAYGGGGYANTTSLTVSGGTLLGVKVLKGTLDGKAYCTLLAIVKATSTSVTVYPNGSNPTSGIGIVSRVGV